MKGKAFIVSVDFRQRDLLLLATVSKIEGNCVFIDLTSFTAHSVPGSLPGAEGAQPCPPRAHVFSRVD